LYRLQWNRVWVASANEDTVALKDATTSLASDKSAAAVSALCWRPDGKLLAAGYTTGLLSIRHIESKESIHVENLDSKITWISWQNIPQVCLSFFIGE
jgi:WD40 repeat protein